MSRRRVPQPPPDDVEHTVGELLEISPAEDHENAGKPVAPPLSPVEEPLEHPQGRPRPLSGGPSVNPSGG
jgi:hypothetical protein